MAARRRPGLDDVAVNALRERVAAGGRPRVAVSGPQFPAATVGTVVRVGDRASDGDDFVIVRVKVNGQSDELGFAPNELALPGSTPAKATQIKAARVKPVRAVPAPATRPVPAPAKPAAPVPEPAPTPAPAPAARAKRRKGAALAKVTITLISDDASWAVSAARGARSLCRSTPIAPGVLTAVAALLDNADIVEAVAEINDVARTAAEERAERLRAELAELDAVLASHRSPAS